VRVVAGVPVDEVIDDLALLYRSVGQDVRVEVLGSPWVQADSGGLAKLLANLLANCARHAPEAQVTIRAAARGSRVRIEVIDNGPGLPPGSTARLLRRGVRGPGSTGAGLGLAICAELVERYRGGFTVVSTPTGCTAVVELPTARHGASVLGSSVVTA
jgi:signal transduction histidine kinase